MEHNPFRQVNYLQQSLSQDKKPLGFLLGAGCPLAIRNADGSPLIPDVVGLTEVVRDKLGDPPTLKKICEHFATDGRPAPNVEDLLSHIRGLSAVAGKEKVRGVTQEELDELDKAMCSEIVNVTRRELPDNKTPYHKLATWVGGSARNAPVEIFTMNYDLLIEQGLEEVRVPYFDGFAGARRPLFDVKAAEEDQLPARWARLWKLHGSINWFQHTTGTVFRTDSMSTSEGDRRVIHPSHLKYDQSRRMPYLVMLDKLRAFLKQPSCMLVACGYSFRDDHINDVLLQGLQANPTSMAFVLMYEDIDQYPKAAQRAAERSNLSVLAKDAAVIGGHQAMWLGRAAEAEATLSPWVKWTPDAADKKLIRSSCHLGDFASLGSFLLSLAGHEAGAEIANGE